MKKIYLFLTAMSFSFLFVACGQDDESENGTETDDDTQEEAIEDDTNGESGEAAEDPADEPEESTVTEETIDGSFTVYGHRDFAENEELLTFSFHRSDQQLSLEERLLDSLVESTETDKLDELDSITVEENTASLYFTENEQLLSMASAEQIYLTETLHEISALYGIETIEFYSGDDLGIEFGQSGTVETMEVEVPDNRGYYVYGDIDGETTYISGVAAGEEVTNENGELMTFAETVEKMQSVQEHASYQAGISEAIEIVDVTVNDRIAEVHYNVAGELNLEDFERVLQLTALDFDFEHLELTNQEAGESKIFLMDLAR